MKLNNIHQETINSSFQIVYFFLSCLVSYGYDTIWLGLKADVKFATDFLDVTYISAVF